MMRLVADTSCSNDPVITDTGHSSLLDSARTPKRIREALNDFALVCRGLAGTVYGSAIAI
jgi:hypothetical protein